MHSLGAASLDDLQQELGAVLRDSEEEIQDVGRRFEELARETDNLLARAAGIVEDLDGGAVHSMGPQVQKLGEEARSFIGNRLAATDEILATVVAETRLLERLSTLTQGQRLIGRETQLLSVVTNIEVARLGQAGSGFEYLARQLEDAHRSVAESTKLLAEHTQERRGAIETTRRVLTLGLPALHRELSHIDEALCRTLAEMDADLAELSGIPGQFRGCVDGIACQIAGVVAAIQKQDITRQQLEHVRESVLLIAELVRSGDDGDSGSEERETMIAAGLAVQGYQLRSIHESVGGWVSQLRSCSEAILHISSAELSRMGPMILAQEQHVSAQLMRIEKLEQECQEDTAAVEGALAGLSTLVQLVSEHQERSRTVRDRLQLLTFNSIIEASHMGSEADAILEVSRSIKRLSLNWTGLTSESEVARRQIVELIEQGNAGSRCGVGEASVAFHNAQSSARAALEELREVARKSGEQASYVDAALEELRSGIGAIGQNAGRLDRCFARVGAAIGAVEEIESRFIREHPEARQGWVRGSVETVFGARYTTQIERAVLDAALNGAPLPAAEQAAAGNGCELF